MLTHSSGICHHFTGVEEELFFYSPYKSSLHFSEQWFRLQLNWSIWRFVPQWFSSSWCLRIRHAFVHLSRGRSSSSRIDFVQKLTSTVISLLSLLLSLADPGFLLGWSKTWSCHEVVFYHPPERQQQMITSFVLVIWLVIKLSHKLHIWIFRTGVTETGAGTIGGIRTFTSTSGTPATGQRTPKTKRGDLIWCVDPDDVQVAEIDALII